MIALAVILTVMWFVCGIAAFHLNVLHEGNPIKLKETALVWLVFFGPFILVPTIFHLLDEACEEDDENP